MIERAKRRTATHTGALVNTKKDHGAAVGALEAFLVLMPAGDDADRAGAMLAEARRQSGAR
jgi:hypothetical protein